jgi:Arc/MetJ-type ribon-helix-helix transcriptional regulator
MDEVDIRIIFSGDLADRNVLPAYEAAQSIEGIVRSFVLIGNYLAEGKVRKKYPYSEKLALKWKAVRPGSFKVISDFVTDTIKRMLKRRVGQAHMPETTQLRELEDRRHGDLDAILDAILPSARKSHIVIGQGATNIFVITGDNNIVKFDASTKHYLKSPKMERELRTKLVSVGSFNVNTRYGRQQSNRCEIRPKLSEILRRSRKRKGIHSIP